MLEELQLDDAAPWKKRYRADAITYTAIAAQAPTRGLASSKRTGVYQLYTWNVPSGELTQITDRPDGKMFGSIDPQGRHIYYLDDKQGDEIGHIVRVPFEGGEKEDVTPELPPYPAQFVRFSASGNMLGLNVGSPEGMQLYAIDMDPDGTLGAPRLLHQSKPMTQGPVLSHGGELAVLASTARSGSHQFSLLAFDMASGEQIAELWDGEGTSLAPVCFSPVPGDMRLLATSNQTGVERPLLWNPRTGERVDFPLETLQGPVEPLDWSQDGRRILFRNFKQAVEHFYLYDLETHVVTKLNSPRGSSGHFAAYFGPGGDIFMPLETSTQPAHVVVLDGQTGVQKDVALAAGEVPPGHPWRSVTFTSSDGEEIQGWLAVPEGEGPFPTILETHGGPSSVELETFSPSSQAWVDHGFAYLTINYRGSTTFGREFQEKINGQLGYWEVEDMVAARQWLIDEGLAAPDQVFLTGWSYGGYLTLQALGTKPDLWAGGMSGIAIADWAVMYEYQAETLRGYQVALFGGTPDEKPEAHASSSPITYVEDVQAPVLIIQGRSDTRTPPRPIELYEERMRALGKPIQVHWFDTGHVGSFSDAEEGIRHQEIMLRFTYRLLAGDFD
ncbi:MAG TPA: S9 family peptidase [Chloroflexi bacterium]|nr:S9 family peptidase [Chloroflexota bacterium]